ncbi:hypothetical protein [Clostridium intestinale]|uniref:Uncharacterized protein n=1 Tax=Clostridium intestinale DSM 6191 TaxID=1121320 RepID=A0A1M5Z9V6_9CLOT|nr:hypothetical protein [Clostridium intestinale]SHI20989.1 hypothetical protein SAMN02745941_02677 [Clostridium intestinale DSM 6191]
MKRSIWSKLLMILYVPFILVFALFSGVSDWGLLINDIFKKDKEIDINKLTR